MTTEKIQLLRDQFLTYVRAFRDSGQDVNTALQQWLEALSPDDVTSALLYAIEDKRGFSRSQSVQQTSKHVASFVGLIAAAQQPESVLDPVCGNGLLLEEVATAVTPKTIHGIDISDAAVATASKLLGERATIIRGDTLLPHQELLDAYQLIVGEPPLGMRLTEQQAARIDGGTRFDDFGHTLAAWAAGRLTDDGKAVLAVSSSFFFARHAARKHEAIHKQGCCIRAAIQLPPGSFTYSSVPGYLVIIEPGPQELIFVGQLTKDAQQQRELLDNFHNFKAGTQPILGRLCQLTEFKGFDSFVARHELKQLVRESGWIPQPAKKVFTDCARMVPHFAASLKPCSRSLYLRIRGKLQASDSLEDLNRGERSGRGHLNVLHLYVAEDIADPRYMVHWFNQTPIGQKTLATLSRDKFFSVRWRDLQEATIHLPPREEQSRVLEALGELASVRSEANELEAALWSGDGDVNDVATKIATINQEDRYIDWVDTLPFPLASILWRHYSLKKSYRHQFRILLHFFEATAAFMATVHYSAFTTVDELWRERGKRLNEKFGEQNLNIERATFGTWRIIFDYLSRVCRDIRSGKYQDTVYEELGSEDGTARDMREENPQGKINARNELLQKMYGTANDSVIQMLADPKLSEILQRANTIRNNWSGHAGAISDQSAKQVHAELKGLVQQVREVFGRKWKHYELIKPGLFECRDGEYFFRSKLIMGTRSPFREVERVSIVTLDTGQLHLFDSTSQKGLKLCPFVEVMPAPEHQADACFILNRYASDRSRFVSYHFEQESDIEFCPAGLDDAIEMILRFNEEDA